MEGEHPTASNGRSGNPLQRLPSRDRISKYQDRVDKLKALEAKDAASQQRIGSAKETSGPARSQSLGGPPRVVPRAVLPPKAEKKVAAKLTKKVLQTKKVKVVAKKVAPHKPKVGRIGRAAKVVVGRFSKTAAKPKVKAAAKAANARSGSASRQSARSAGAQSKDSQSRKGSVGSKQSPQKKKVGPVGATLKQTKSATVQKVVRNRGRDPRDEIPKVEKFHRKPRAHIEPAERTEVESVPKRAAKPRPVRPAVPSEPANVGTVDLGDLITAIDAVAVQAAHSEDHQMHQEPTQQNEQPAQDEIDITMMIEAQEATAKKDVATNSGEKKSHHRSNEKTMPTAMSFSNLMFDGDDQAEAEPEPQAPAHQTPDKHTAEHHSTHQQSASKMVEEVPSVHHQEHSSHKQHHEATPQKSVHAVDAHDAHHSNHASAQKPASPAPVQSHPASAAKPEAAAQNHPNQSESSMTSQNNSSSQGEEHPDQPNPAMGGLLDLESLAGAQQQQTEEAAQTQPAVEHESAAKENTENVSFF